MTYRTYWTYRSYRSYRIDRKASSSFSIGSPMTLVTLPSTFSMDFNALRTLRMIPLAFDQSRQATASAVSREM